MSGPATAAPGAAAAVGAIALNTFREAIRDRVLYLLLAFALLVIGAGRFLGMLTVGDEAKIVKDLGLSAISIFGLLTAVFVGVSLVFKEIEKRTVMTLLAHPVRRWQFVAGKYAGLAAVLLVNTGLMGAVLSLLVVARGDSPAPVAIGIATIFVELLVVASFAVLFSSFTNPILAAVGTVAVYVAGHLSWSFELLKRRLPEGPARLACDAARAIVPNLDRLDLKAEAVHAVPIEPARVALATAYGLAYALAVLLLACAVFSRRDFE